MPDLFSALSSFCEADVVSLVARESALLLSRNLPREHPYAILLAGQPGAGKTELSTMLVSQLDGGAAFLNGDDYRRYHPNYRRLYSKYGSDSVQMTSAFSSAVTERLIESLSDHRLNLVIEGTGRTVDVPRTTSERLANKGYTVEMAVIAARPEVSLVSTLRRFYRMNSQGTIPRATALAAHDAVVDALPFNLDALLRLSSISRISIWDRELIQLFDSQFSTDSPSDILLRYWHRPWTTDELLAIRQQVDELSHQENKLSLGQRESIDLLIQRIDTAARSISEPFEQAVKNKQYPRRDT